MFQEDAVPASPASAPQGPPVLGIISTALGSLTLLVLAILFIGLIIMVTLTASSPEDIAEIQEFVADYQRNLMDPAYEPSLAEIPQGLLGLGVVALALGLCLFASPMVAVVGLVIGIVGITQPAQPRILSIIGTSLNAALLLTSCCLVVVGLAGQ